MAAQLPTPSTANGEHRRKIRDSCNNCSAQVSRPYTDTRRPRRLTCVSYNRSYVVANNAQHVLDVLRRSCNATTVIHNELAGGLPL